MGISLNLCGILTLSFLKSYQSDSKHTGVLCPQKWQREQRQRSWVFMWHIVCYQKTTQENRFSKSLTIWALWKTKSSFRWHILLKPRVRVMRYTPVRMTRGTWVATTLHDTKPPLGKWKKYQKFSRAYWIHSQPHPQEAGFGVIAQGQARKTKQNPKPNVN